MTWAEEVGQWGGRWRRWKGAAEEVGQSSRGRSGGAENGIGELEEMEEVGVEEEMNEVKEQRMAWVACTGAD